MSKYQTDSLFASEEADLAGCNHIIRVAFGSAADTEFDYLVPDVLWPIEAGQRIEAPFGRKNKSGKQKNPPIFQSRSIRQNDFTGFLITTNPFQVQDSRLLPVEGKHVLQGI